MILLVARVPVKEDKVDAFLKEAAQVAEPSRKEEGCVSYEYFISGEGPETVLFLERWKDKAAIDYHNGTDHFLRFQQNIQSLAAGAPEVVFYPGDPVEL